MNFSSSIDQDRMTSTPSTTTSTILYRLRSSTAKSWGGMASAQECTQERYNDASQNEKTDGAGKERQEIYRIRGLERVKGIEPSYSAWKAAALPLSYTRMPF
jgi:hypothetical protein